MAEKDLEKTKPIKVLKDISDIKKDTTSTREAKYKDALEKAEMKIKEEEAEEALAEKNINEAEELLHEEKVKKEKVKELEKEVDEEIEESTNKEGIFVKLKNKWNKLNKKQRILAMVLGFVLLFVVLLLVILLIFKLTSKPEDKPLTPPPVEEEVPVVVDNFYYKDGTLHFLNEAETEIGTYECSNKDNSLCYVAINYNRDNFDMDKLVDEEGNLKEQRMVIYNDDYVFIYDNKSEKNNEIVLYSIKEGKEINRYYDVKSYKTNYVIVKDKDDKYGLIYIDENKGIVEKIKCQYKYLGMFGGTNLIAQTKDGYFVINEKGKELSEPFSSSTKIKNYNDNFVVTLTGNEYSVYDYEGNLIDGGYEFATVYEKYALFVKDNRVYVRDKDKNKYTESGIKLNTSDYVKTFVFDESDKLVKTLRSFEVNVNSENELEFTLWKNDTDEVYYERISLAEVNVNKNYEYMNYFDGKLYFYEDEEKEKLLGFYTCTNSNTVDMKSTKYASCYVASDTLFSDNDMIPEGYLYRNSTIPIINNRYVFISDGNNNIVLFDLEDKVDKSSYSKVETNTLDNQYKITKYSGDMDVIVQNKKKKYAVITVRKDTIEVKYGFDYDKLEFFGEYILGLDSSNNWRILFDNVESMGFTNKIRGYSPNKKYFKIMENDKYYVYNESANKVCNDSYAYVGLYTDYYVALDSNRNLSVYDYTGTKLSNDTAKIGNYALYGDVNPAFKVKKDGDNYIVSIFDGTKYSDTTLNKIPEVVEEEETTPDVDTTPDEVVQGS